MGPLTAEDGAVVTLTAVWTPIQYSFRFYLEGGNLEGYGPSDASDSITIEYTIEDVGEDGLVPPEPSKTDYTFLGWVPYRYSSEPIEKITSNDFHYDWACNLYAKWERTKIAMEYLIDPAYSNGQVTDVSSLLKEGKELPRLAPGDSLPSRYTMDDMMNPVYSMPQNAFFLYWVDKDGIKLQKSRRMQKGLIRSTCSMCR